MYPLAECEFARTQRVASAQVLQQERAAAQARCIADHARLQQLQGALARAQEECGAAEAQGGRVAAAADANATALHSALGAAAEGDGAAVSGLVGTS